MHSKEEVGKIVEEEEKTKEDRIKDLIEQVVDSMSSKDEFRAGMLFAMLIQEYNDG